MRTYNWGRPHNGRINRTTEQRNRRSEGITRALRERNYWRMGEGERRLRGGRRNGDPATRGRTQPATIALRQPHHAYGRPLQERDITERKKNRDGRLTSQGDIPFPSPDSGEHMCNGIQPITLPIIRLYHNVDGHHILSRLRHQKEISDRREWSHTIQQTTSSQRVAKRGDDSWTRG